MNDHVGNEQRLPSALDGLKTLLEEDPRTPALFLDYDGTLSPIVPRPEDAILSDGIRDVLERLSRICVVAILSGRDLEDVRRRVGIPSLWYAGSHGFDIAGPDGAGAYRHGEEFLPELDAAEQAVRPALAGIAGCQLERKRFAITVHFRRVAASDVAAVEAQVRAVHREHPGLRLALGKKILELQPDVPWHKGHALAWLVDALKLDTRRTLCIYIGDDTTDEDAFAEVADYGVGILVGPADASTRALWQLEDTAAVQAFLERLLAARSLGSRKLD